LRDGREVTIREIEAGDASEIVAAFERLSSESRYSRFMQHKKQLDAGILERGVHPRPGLDFVLVATVPAPDGIDIVGAAQYVRARADDDRVCEFALTVAEGWRGNGLATALMSRLLRRARRDGYETIEGQVLASNASMLALAHALHFSVERVADEPGVVCVRRELQTDAQEHPARQDPASTKK